MRSWWGEGVGSRISLVVVVDIRRAVVAAVVGVACAGPRLVSRLFDTAPLHWGSLRCHAPCRFPFAENVGCLVADKLPAVGIVAIAGGFAAVPAIVVLVPLGVPAIDVGGRRWPTHITVLVPSRYLLRLHLRLVWLLYLHGVYYWSSLAHGRHLKLQCIHCSL